MFLALFLIWNMAKEKTVKTIVFLMALTILVILILAAPAQAFISGLTIFNNNVTRGAVVNMVASVNPENANLNVNYLILNLTAQNNIPAAVICKFLPDGTIVSGCTGIKILKVDVLDQYGYTLNNLQYNISINTLTYVPADYKTSLSISTDNKTIVQAGSDLQILAVGTLKESCSIRAKDSNIIVNGQSFPYNNKLNFYIPLPNAVNGNGYLIGQSNKQTFDFEFKSVKVLDNDQSTLMLLLISGKYRIGLGPFVTGNAIITLNKKTNTLSVMGNGINASNMQVTFKNGCSR